MKTWEFLNCYIFISEGLQQHRIHTVNPTGPVGVHGIIRKGDYLLEVSPIEIKILFPKLHV